MSNDLRRVPSDWTHGDPTELLSPIPLDESSDDYWFARHVVGLARSGAMFHGRFVEVHVARILGAHLPTTGINEWDLLVPDADPIRVEVKASTGHKAEFRLSSKQKNNGISLRSVRRRPQVWVFVHSPDRNSSDFTYLVASDSLVESLGTTIGLKSAKRRFKTVPKESLLSAVREASPTT